jgi:hypothetical protein
MDYNLMLTWMSERGSGSWQQFREGHAWLETSSGQQAGDVPAARTLEHLARLGHVEVARGESKWAVTPPVITIVPGASVHAVVVGARTTTFLGHLSDGVDATQHLELITRSQAEGPDVLYISCSDESLLTDLARKVGARYEYSVGERLSHLLPDLAAILKTGAAPPPAVGFGVGRWDPDSNRFPLTDKTALPGLYRYEVYGAAQFRFCPEPERYVDVDLSTGRFAELNRLGRAVLEYEAESINGTLKVPVKSDLPALQARAAILCSGLLPNFDRQTYARLYWNVPLVIAERIARSLGQTLRIKEQKK